jgi:hypothetical protein
MTIFDDFTILSRVDKILICKPGIKLHLEKESHFQLEKNTLLSRFPLKKIYLPIYKWTRCEIYVKTDNQVYLVLFHQEEYFYFNSITLLLF